MARTVVHLLDVGHLPYGDCLVLELDAGDGNVKRVLVDGGHRSDQPELLAQFETIFGHARPFDFDLLVISHAHDDHIGAIPGLVENGDITVSDAFVPDIDMAFGAAAGGLDAEPDGAARAIALWREEPIEDELDASALDTLSLDAATLADRYRNMLSNLERDGTRIVLFGNADSGAALQALQQTFAPYGFEVLGPLQQSLDRSAELLTAAINALVSDVARLDVGLDAIDVVAQLDSGKRAGHLVNAQSAVCRFSVPAGDADAHQVLLGGDFQFADLGSSDDVLTAECTRLLEAISNRAPYDFVKLGHHGSSNAVDEAFLTAIGTTNVVGLISGRGHPKHPDPATLQLLSERAAKTSWVRTDRSGHIQVVITDNGVSIRPAGAKNLAELNEADAVPAPPSPHTFTTSGRLPVQPELRTELQPLGPPSAAPQPRDSMSIEIPARATSIDIHIALAAATSTPERSDTIRPPAPIRHRLPPAPLPPRVETTRSMQFQIGGGRSLANLLFLTDTTRLADHIDRRVVTTILDAIHTGGHDVCDIASAPGAQPPPVAAIEERLWAQLDTRVPEHVVILGGYDVVPSQQIDVIAPETPPEAADGMRGRDPDSFVVWSDDPYVNIDGLGLPDLPISRIPDGHDALFTLKVLQASPSPSPLRHGIRNTHRPFIEDIFTTLPGDGALLISDPEQTSNLDPQQLRTGWGYYMLHGLSSDSTRFWGETQTRQHVEAVHIAQLPTEGVDIAVVGCCWGALPASSKACDWEVGQPIAGRLPNQSIALTLLAAGARAVIGCTGAHYSPTKPPFDTASGPLHRSLWKRILEGVAPAEALFQAKYDLAEHNTTLTDPTALAVANKTLHQFTCLGLGT